MTTTPLQTLDVWLAEARAEGVLEPEAMALATVGPDGRPSIRYVLCRGIDEHGVRFYTNYQSRKGQELAARPQAAAVFHWSKTKHQVRVEGDVELVSPGDSDLYFHSRARGSQLAASVSPQSQPIPSLDVLRDAKQYLEDALKGAEVPRPPHWGGYRIRARSVELWTSGEDRLHDRVRYDRQGDTWIATRLAP